VSTQHGPVVIKPISEVAQFQKNLIPANISEIYSIKPMFKSIASDEDIKKGIIAFRDFLYIFCDCLISDGHLYAKPPKKPGSMADYPFLFNVTNLLVDIGYNSRLAGNGNSLIVDELPLCTPSFDANSKKKPPKISSSSLIECLRFLSLCGFDFTGVDLDTGKFNTGKNSKRLRLRQKIQQTLSAQLPGNPHTFGRFDS